MQTAGKSRIGLIGAGHVCRIGHGPGIRADGRAYIAAISDPDEHNRKLFAKKFGVEGIYSDHREMLEKEDLDAVIISSPPWAHAQHVKDCAGKGLPMLCEKPMATTLEDCRTIIDAGKSHGVYIMMGHCKRFEPGHQKIRDMLARNLLGRIFQISVFWYFFVPDISGGWLGRANQRLKRFGYTWSASSASGATGISGPVAVISSTMLPLHRHRSFLGFEIEQVSCETSAAFLTRVPTRIWRWPLQAIQWRGLPL
jgi:hypothetical protein